MVLPAVLETPPGRDAYGHIEVYADRLRLVGVDTCMSLEMPVVGPALALALALAQPSGAGAAGAGTQ